MSPVINRRLLVSWPWWSATGTLILGALLVLFGRGSPPRPGQMATLTVTIVPMDAAGLECAASTVLEGHRCAFDGHQRRVEDGRRLRPFVTTARELVLLSGVFESPQVAEWAQRARGSRNQTRVTLRCNTRLLGVMPSVATRWAPDGSFKPERDVLAADVAECVIEPPIAGAAQNSANRQQRPRKR